MFEPFTRTGVGLHTGHPCEVITAPSSPGQGVVFETLQGSVRANAHSIDPSSRRATDLIANGARIRTVEHLLAALAWCGEADATITVDGPEIPILDGSAGPWIASLIAASATPGPRFFRIAEPIAVRVKDASAVMSPLGPECTPSYTVELHYPDPTQLGSLRATFHPTTDDFVAQIAAARTFAMESEVADLQAAGLGRGGSLENALIIGRNGPLNPCGARFRDEPARHKLLDVIGDLFLLGGLPWADIRAFRPGHRLMHELVRRVAPQLAPVPR